MVTDFDEQMARFASATFSLNGLMRNELDRTAVQSNISVGGDVVGRDKVVTEISNAQLEQVFGPLSDGSSLP